MQSAAHQRVITHAFWALVNIFTPFKTSQRRSFERDVYDFARAIGMIAPDARRQVQLARKWCGNLKIEETDDDFSAWAGEENDIEPLQVSSWESTIDWDAQTGAHDEELIGQCQNEISTSIDDVIQSMEADRPTTVLRTLPCQGQEIRETPSPDYVHDHFEQEKELDVMLPHTDKGNKEEKDKRNKGRKDIKKPQLETEPEDDKFPPADKRENATASAETRNQQASPGRSALDSINQQEAHANFLRSSEKDPNMADWLAEDDDEVDSKRKREQFSEIDSAIRGLRDFGLRKQVELYERGGMKRLDKRAKADLERLKAQRQAAKDSQRKSDRKSRNKSDEKSQRREKKKLHRLKERFRKTHDKDILHQDFQ